MTKLNYYQRQARIVSAGKYLAIGLTALAIFLTFTLRMGSHHRDGVSVGTLINVRDEGVLWGNPSGELLHSGEMAGEDFAIEGAALEVTARAFASTGERVRVRYIERYVCWAWNYAACKVAVEITPDVAGARQ